MSGFLETRANLGGKVAALVGGADVIGRAPAVALARAGMDVAICGHDAAQLDAVRQEVEKCGRRTLALQGDATEPGFLDRFYDSVGQTFDRLDVAVNAIAGVKRGFFMDASRAQIAADIQRNFGYVIQSVQRAVPLIRRGARGGSIINFTTIEAHRGAATFSVYAGARAGTTNFTRSVAVELGAERIRLNCIAADAIPDISSLGALSDDMRDAMLALSPEQMAMGMSMYIPMKQQPPLEALADAVLFLASDLSAFVTGVTLHVDGGTMAASGFLDWPFGDGFVPVPLAGTLPRLQPK